LNRLPASPFRRRALVAAHLLERIMTRLSLLAAVAASLATAPIAAFAHAHLHEADPAAGSTVRSAPSEITLTFSEDVEPRFSTIEVHDVSGTRVDKADPHIASGNARRLMVTVGGLKPGTYKVVWHATSVDTHRTEGSYRFTVAP
jgi:methionine-rich copper-binding protein CopC